MSYNYNPQINFKPEFGNIKHITIVNSIGKLNKMHAELKKKRDAQKGGDTLEKECQRLLHSIEFMIKNANETDT